MIEQVQINQMTEQGPVVIHPETTSSNVLHGDGTIDKIVTLDGVVQTNFNFIENKVVQDGLIDNRYNIDMNRNNVNPYAGYYISYSYDNLRDLNMFYIDFTGVTSGTGFYVEDYINNNNVIISIPYSNLVNRGFLVTININKILNLLEIKFQDGYTVTKNILSTYKFSFFGNSIGNYGCLGKINSFWYYSRTLTPQEIQHNFSVLNSTPAIKDLHTTDAEGKTSILKLGSDEDHVEMASGRTLREEYMGVLKTMGKEFTSADGNPVEVPNGIEARVISGEIKGQTVKVISKDGNTQLKLGGNNPRTANYILGGLIEANKQYHITTICTSQSGNPDLWLSDFGPSLSPKVKTGINKNIVTFTNVSSNLNLTIALGQSDFDAGKTFEGYLIISENGFVENPLSFGLHSTQAAINNNNQSYEIYEPQILGKTRILKAPKGTQNWVEISADETRDTAKFDYKLDSINGDLGGTPSVNDYIDRARKVKTVNTFDEDITINTQWTDINGIAMAYVNNRSIGGFDNIIRVVSNNVKTVGRQDGQSGTFKGCMYVRDNTLVYVYETGENLSVAKNKLIGSKVRYQLATPVEVPLTDEELAQYDAYKKVISLGSTPTKKDTLEIKDDGSAIYTQNTKDADDGSARIDLPAPIMTHIDKSLLPTIITQQTNTIEVGGAVKPSSFKVTVPTTDGIKKEYTLTPINGWAGTAKANLLQTGDVGLVIDLTIPEQFNTLITNLPNELKPKSERTVLGYNGNTPVVVKIGADGTVKLPVAATGTVKLDDTYKL